MVSRSVRPSCPVGVGVLLLISCLQSVAVLLLSKILLYVKRFFVSYVSFDYFLA